MIIRNTSTSTIDELAVQSCSSLDRNTEYSIIMDCKCGHKNGVVCRWCNNFSNDNMSHRFENVEQQQHSTKKNTSELNDHQSPVAQTHNDLICRQRHKGQESTDDWPECSECDGQAPDINNDTCFEYEGRNFCHYHYSLKLETRCVSCNMAVLKEFVQVPNELKKGKWHPTCYMIQKSWNVHLQKLCPIDGNQYIHSSFTNFAIDVKYKEDVLITIEPDALVQLQTATEIKVERIWTDLSTFEESAATCISDMLLHFAAGARIECLQMMSQFVYHVQVLFSTLDTVVNAMISYEILGVPEVKSVCDQMVRLLHLLADQPQHRIFTTPSAVAQQVLGLVTGVAQNLKSIIRTALVQSLELEENNRSTTSAIDRFLEGLLPLEKKRLWAAGRYWFKADPALPGGIHNALHSEKTIVAVDSCYGCKKSIEDGEYLKQEHLKWHYHCFACSACHRTLSNTLWDARLMEHDNNKKPKDATHSWKLACEDCYDSNTKTFNQKEQPRLFSRVSCFEKHLEPVRVTLAHYLSLYSGEQEVGETTPLRTRSKRRTLSLLRHSDRYPQPEHFLQHGQKSNNDRAVKRSTTLLDRSSLNRFGSIRRALSTAEKRKSHPVPSRSTITTTAEACTSSRTLFMLDLISPEKETLMRYLAALSLANNTPCLLTLNDVIALVDPDQQRVKQSLWSKLKKRIHASQEQTTARLHDVLPLRVFGVPLTATTNVGSMASAIRTTFPSQMMHRLLSEASAVPPFMKQCISAMLGSDMSVEGVFRKNGNIRDLNATCEAIDRDPEMCETLLQALSPIQLSALLKRYLHGLPEPLLTYKLYDLWITASKLDNTACSKYALHLVFCLLPKPNRDTFQLLCLFLKWVASFQVTNKMDTDNLARVIAPTILYTPVPHSKSLIGKCTKDEIKVVELLILYQDEFLMIPSTLSSLVNDPRATEIIASASSTRQAVKTLHQYMLASTPSSV